MMIALVLLPLLAAVALTIVQAVRARFWLDLATCLLVLALAIVLAIVGPDGTPLLRQDRLGALTAILVAAASVAIPISRGKPLVLTGSMLAALAAHPVLGLAGIALSVAATLVPRIATAWHRVPLAGGALGLLLFGSIVPAAPLATLCGPVGLAALAYLAPELLPVLTLLALPVAGPPLAALGLAGVIGCGLVALYPARRAAIPWMTLGQASVIGVAFGLRSPATIFAGLVLATLLVVAQAARALAADGGLTRLLADAGLAGFPPFGVFPGLALTIGAVAKQTPVLCVPLLAGIGLLSWASMRVSTAPRFTSADRWSAAWLPLAIAVPLGWALPGDIAGWLHALALEWVR